MNVLFIYELLDRPFLQKIALNSWTKIQLGISYISALLKQAGHQTRLLIPRHAFYKHDVDTAVKEFPPDVICFTSISSTYPYVESIARYIRRKVPQVFLIIGGPHASLQPLEVSQGPYDAVCVGEGEYPMLELLSTLEKKEEPTDIPNLWLRKGDEIEKNSCIEFIANLDKLPFPDRDMWRPWVYNDKRHMILIGRGCLWSCTYCCNHAFRRLTTGKYVRQRSPSYILKEVKQLCEDFPDVTDVYFEVESIATQPHWIFDFCKRLEAFNASREKPLNFGTNIRARRKGSFQQIFKAMRQAGFSEINLGLESGSESIRINVLRRLETNEDLIRTCDEAHEAGLRINAYNMIGIPGETPEDFKETIELNRRCLPERDYLSIFYPYPGTHLHRQSVEMGYCARDRKQNPERFKPVLKLPAFHQRKILHYFRWFDWYVYSGKKSIFKILGQVIFRTLGIHWFFLQTFRSITSFGLLARHARHLQFK